MRIPSLNDNPKLRPTPEEQAQLDQIRDDYNRALEDIRLEYEQKVRSVQFAFDAAQRKYLKAEAYINISAGTIRCIPVMYEKNYGTGVPHIVVVLKGLSYDVYFPQYEDKMDELSQFPSQDLLIARVKEALKQELGLPLFGEKDEDKNER